jgi:hypothetical protein
MLGFHERYLTDAKGRRVAVVLDLADYERLVAELERLKEAAGDKVKALEEPIKPDPELITEALSIIGIGEDAKPLIDGKPVSEYADLYLYGGREADAVEDDQQ